LPLSNIKHSSSLLTIYDDNFKNIATKKLIINDLEGKLFYKKQEQIERFTKFGVRGSRAVTFSKGLNEEVEGENNNVFFLNSPIFTSHSSIIFIIYYHTGHSSYFLKKLNDNYLMYEQIEKFKFSFKNKHFILIGNVFLCIEIVLNDFTRQILIEVYLEEDEKMLKKYIFQSIDCPITIGRRNSKLKLNSQSISKIHCSINIDIDFNFYIQDGYNGKLSTNGVWKLIDETIKLDKLAVFKIFNQSFKVQVK
jgi:hypothetical protein